jgi:hypothetical protein
MKTKRIITRTAACAALLAIPLSALAQTSTQTGLVNAVGQASSNSSSAANALSLSQGGGGGTATATGGSARARGGNSNANAGNNQASVTFNQPGQTTATNTIATRTRSSGSLRTTANAFAPQLVASAVGTCLGSVSSGVGATGFGFSFGTTVPDKSCDLRMFSEALLKAGQRNAATAILCKDPNVYQAFTSVGITCPLVPDGYQVAGYPPGTQPYQVVPDGTVTGVEYTAPVRRAVRRTSRRSTDVIPAGRTYIPAPQSMNAAQQVITAGKIDAGAMAERVNLEQAEATAAAARLREEYAREKEVCQMTGGVAC